MAFVLPILMAQSADELVSIPEPILKGIKAQADQVMQNLGGKLAWPGLLRRLDRNNADYKT